MIVRADGKQPNVGRKKRPIPVGTTKVEKDLLRMIDLMARHQGTDVTEWISRTLRPIVEREYAAFIVEQEQIQKGEK